MDSGVFPDDVSGSGPGGPPTPPSQWLSLEEEVAWVGSLEEMPFVFAGSVITCLGLHISISLAIKAGAPTDIPKGTLARLPNRIISMIHSLVMFSVGVYWMLAGERSSKLFSYNQDIQDLKSASAGVFLYGVMFLAGNLEFYGSKKILGCVFLTQAAALVCFVIDRAFPLSLSTWVFFTLSIAQLPVVLSTLSYLAAKFCAKPYIQINAALVMLASHVAAVLISVYVAYTAILFLFKNELWSVKGYDPRVTRLGLPYCVATAVSLAVICYTNWMFFSSSVEHVKAKFINPRVKPSGGAASQAAPPSKPGPRAASGPKGSNLPASARSRKKAH